MSLDYSLTNKILLFLLVLIVQLICSCNSASENHPGNNIIDSTKIKALANSYTKGKEIFESYCVKCHFSPEKHITDQLLINLFEHLPQPSEEYFSSFIKDSKKLKASGDKYALELSNAWNINYDHEFKDSLSEQNINDLIIYLKVATKRK